MATEYFFEAGEIKLPILLSSPHSGTEFPDGLRPTLKSEFRKHPQDTDWFIHRLYGFVKELGIPMIHARYSRYVVDLNRDPEETSLYGDGRVETGLVPVMSFAQQSLYEGAEPDDEEKRLRVKCYHRPYHEKVQSVLSDIRSRFGVALLFDAHSIKRFVPSIRQTPFPDVILGNQRGKTAGNFLIESAWKTLENSAFSAAHNDPFMGGYITRHFGRPDEGQHALQLEMSQDLYMNESEATWNPEKALAVQRVLRDLLQDLGKLLLGAR